LNDTSRKKQKTKKTKKTKKNGLSQQTRLSIQAQSGCLPQTTEFPHVLDVSNSDGQAITHRFKCGSVESSHPARGGSTKIVLKLNSVPYAMCDDGIAARSSAPPLAPTRGLLR
jgi:hypothetical protein